MAHLATLSGLFSNRKPVFSPKSLQKQAESTNFANKKETMEKFNITHEEAVRRWNAAKEHKRQMVAKMEAALREDYIARTGKQPITFNVL